MMPKIKDKSKYFMSYCFVYKKSKGCHLFCRKQVSIINIIMIDEILVWTLNNFKQL